MFRKCCIILVCMFIVAQFVTEGQTTKKKRSQCDFEQPECGLCGRYINVTVTVVNTLSEPTFEYAAVVRARRRDLLSILEEVPQVKKGFNFTLTYSGSNGYTIDAVNGVEASENSKTYWRVFSNNTLLECGVFHYVPKNEETIVLNYTSIETKG